MTEIKKASREGGVGTQQIERVSKRFYGTVHLNPMRMASEAGTIGQEIVQHMQALLGSDVEVTLEITAKNPDGFPPNVIRTVTENARTLKFENIGFEEE